MCGSSASVGSLTITRVAPSSGSSSPARRAGPSHRCGRGCRRARRGAPSRPRSTASPASRRFETSFRGSWSRKTSIPFSAAQETKRPTMSPETGASRRESARAARSRAGSSCARRSRGCAPTGSRPAAAPLCRSHHRPRPRGRRTPRCRGSPQSRRISPVGTLPARGSCERSRMVVSTSCGTAGAYLRSGFSRRHRGRAALRRGRCSGLARIDLDPLADVHEQRHLDDGAGLEGCGLRDVRDGVAAAPPGSVSATVSSTDAGSWMPAGLPLTVRICTVDDGSMYASSSATSPCGKPELLERLLVHEVRLGAVVVEELDVLHLGVDARELLAGAERLVDDRSAIEILELRPHERAALARLHVLELDDAPHRALELDVHPVPELVGVDDVCHAQPSLVALGAQPTTIGSLRERREPLVAVARDERRDPRSGRRRPPRSRAPARP